MKKIDSTYNLFQSVSAIFMSLILLWLTISTPFMFANSWQQLVECNSEGNNNVPPADSDEAANAFPNTGEEKKSSNSSIVSEEFLHNNHNSDHFFSPILNHHKFESSGTYIAFHGELLVPPPNFI